MSRPVHDVPAPQRASTANSPPADGPPAPKGMSRREAIPIIGLAVAAAYGCNLPQDMVEVDPNDKANQLRQMLAAARVHRGGMQKFAYEELKDAVAVRVEPVGTIEHPDLVDVTVVKVDPATWGFVRDGGEPRILEMHRGVSNAGLSQIESEYVLFYYLYPEHRVLHESLRSRESRQVLLRGDRS